MLLVLVSLLCCVPAASACLQCDRSVRLLHENFILSAPSVSDQIALQTISDHAYVTYRDTSQQRQGVIDPTTLYRARTEYQSEFDRFLNTPLTGTITFEAIQIMEKGRQILEKHLDAFIPDGLCPNKCGLLNRRVMDCVSCRFKIHICPSPSGQQDCGEQPVQAEEGGQAVLDCFLPWHRLLLGKPEYHYFWAPGAPGSETVSLPLPIATDNTNMSINSNWAHENHLDESDFKALVVTDDSSVVLNQLRVDEQGTYRCSLQDRNGTIFYQVTFLLTVAPLPRQTHRSLASLPALPLADDSSPFQPTEDLLVPVIAMVTAVSVTASVGITVVLGLMANQQRAAKELRRRRREEQDTENTV